jgi:hypothetical protein
MDYGCFITPIRELAHHSPVNARKHEGPYWFWEKFQAPQQQPAKMTATGTISSRARAGDG